MGTTASRCGKRRVRFSLSLATMQPVTAIVRSAAVTREATDGGVADGCEPAGSHVPGEDGDGFDRRVDRPGADRLDLDAPFAGNAAGDGARHGDRLRGGRNLEHLYWSALHSHCWNPFKYVHGRLAGSL